MTSVTVIAHSGKVLGGGLGRLRDVLTEQGVTDPIWLEAALEVGLHGNNHTIDVGKMNGEHFAVMAGIGLDALMIRDADSGMKDRFGRVAYIWRGARHIRSTSR